MPSIRGYLLSMDSKDNFGIQHSLELLFFKELILVVFLSFVTSIVCPIISGANTDATGIRQYEIELIPNPNNTVPTDGNDPNSALPIFTVLQVTYWVIAFVAATIITVIIGKLIQSIYLKGCKDSLNWKIVKVIKKKRIATGRATVSESVVGTFISGLDITNKLQKVFIQNVSQENLSFGKLKYVK